GAKCACLVWSCGFSRWSGMYTQWPARHPKRTASRAEGKQNFGRMPRRQPTFRWRCRASFAFDKRFGAAARGGVTATNAPFAVWGNGNADRLVELAVTLALLAPLTN